MGGDGKKKNSGKKNGSGLITNTVTATSDNSRVNVTVKTCPEPAEEDVAAAAIAQRNADLDEIKRVTTESRDTFVSDVDSYTSNLSTLEDVPCTTVFAEYMAENGLNITSIVDDFDEKLVIIDSEYM